MPAPRDVSGVGPFQGLAGYQARITTTPIEALLDAEITQICVIVNVQEEFDAREGTNPHL